MQHRVALRLAVVAALAATVFCQVQADEPRAPLMVTVCQPLRTVSYNDADGQASTLQLGFSSPCHEPKTRTQTLQTYDGPIQMTEHCASKGAEEVMYFGSTEEPFKQAYLWQPDRVTDHRLFVGQSGLVPLSLSIQSIGELCR